MSRSALPAPSRAGSPVSSQPLLREVRGRAQGAPSRRPPAAAEAGTTSAHQALRLERTFSLSTAAWQCPLHSRPANTPPPSLPPSPITPVTTTPSPCLTCRLLPLLLKQVGRADGGAPREPLQPRPGFKLDKTRKRKR